MITTIVRNRIDSNKLYGYVIMESDSLLMIAKEVDFQFDGFKIIRKRDITNREITDTNKYCARIMKLEKCWVKIPSFVKSIDLSDWKTALSGIRSDVVILHNEKLDGGFYIGPILTLNTKNVDIGWFDGTGKWGEPDRIPYSKITACDFMDRYSSIHSKYLKWT